MEIKTIENFLSYFEKTRQITRKVVEVVPPDKLDWSYRTGKFTLGDLIRHIAAIERHVFAEMAIGNRPNYQGCGKELADGFPAVLHYFDAMHAESLALFKTLNDRSLDQNIRSVDGKEIVLGSFLRALFVHEIHHRGALCIYLNMLGVETPPIIGLKEEQVIQFSRK